MFLPSSKSVIESFGINFISLHWHSQLAIFGIFYFLAKIQNFKIIFWFCRRLSYFMIHIIILTKGLFLRRNVHDTCLEEKKETKIISRCRFFYNNAMPIFWRSTLEERKQRPKLALSRGTCQVVLTSVKNNIIYD